MPITDLNLYRNKAYLELCLDLVEEAYGYLRQGHCDLAASQLQDILQTFEIQAVDTKNNEAVFIDLSR